MISLSYVQSGVKQAICIQNVCSVYLQLFPIPNPFHPGMELFLASFYDWIKLFLMFGQSCGHKTCRIGQSLKVKISFKSSPNVADGLRSHLKEGRDDLNSFCMSPGHRKALTQGVLFTFYPAEA